MKKYLLYICLFFGVLFVIDRAVGVGCEYLKSHAKGGDQGNAYYICKRSDERVLIFGSSRANHHYVPQIFEDSLGLTCYNCGVDGNGIIFHYGRLLMITKRYKPDLILYDINPVFDCQEGDNMKFLDALKPYYDENGIDSIFGAVNSNEKYKMCSYMYRYNHKFVQMLSDCIKPQQIVIKGYKPLYGTMIYEPENETKNLDEHRLDPLKMNYLRKFIALCKEEEIHLVFTASPLWNGKGEEYLNPIIKLCTDQGVPFINHYSDKDFCHTKLYFEDSVHMNDKGAKRFSSVIVSALRKMKIVTD